MGPSFEVKSLRVSLTDLQGTLNSVNVLEPPLIQLQFDSMNSVPGTSELTIDVQAKDAADIPQPIHSVIPLKDLAFSGHQFYFQHLNSTSLTASLDQHEPLALVLEIPFQTDGPNEIKIGSGDAIDLRFFKIYLRLDIDRQNNWLDIFSFVWEIENALTEGSESVTGPYTSYSPRGGFGTTSPPIYHFTTKFRGERISEASNQSTQLAKQAVRDTLIERFVGTNVSVNAWWSEIPWSWLNDGEDRVRRAFNLKIYDKIKEELKLGANSPNSITTLLNTMVSKLLGIKESYYVTSVTRDGNYLNITYIDFPKP